MGKAISRLEKILRAGFPKTPRGERAVGFVLALLLPVGTLAVTILALWAVGLIHPILRFALGVFWGWQALALKGLNPTIAISAILIAQLLVAAAIDYFGRMGQEKMSFDWRQWTGVGLMLTGVLFMKWR